MNSGPAGEKIQHDVVSGYDIYVSDRAFLKVRCLELYQTMERHRSYSLNSLNCIGDYEGVMEGDTWSIGFRV